MNFFRIYLSVLPNEMVQELAESQEAALNQVAAKYLNSVSWDAYVANNGYPDGFSIEDLGPAPDEPPANWPRNSKLVYGDSTTRAYYIIPRMTPDMIDHVADMAWKSTQQPDGTHRGLYGREDSTMDWRPTWHNEVSRAILDPQEMAIGLIVVPPGSDPQDLMPAAIIIGRKKEEELTVVSCFVSYFDSDFTKDFIRREVMDQGKYSTTVMAVEIPATLEYFPI